VRFDDRAQFKKGLVDLAAFWKQVQPNKSFPARLAAAIPADMPIGRAQEVVDAVRDAGFTHIDALEVWAPRWSPTRTLGDVPHAPRGCWVGFESSRDLPTAGTWGDFVRGEEKGRRPDDE
jgi:hypothetical protein